MKSGGGHTHRRCKLFEICKKRSLRILNIVPLFDVSLLWLFSRSLFFSIHLFFSLTPSTKNLLLRVFLGKPPLKSCFLDTLPQPPLHSGKSLFPNICGLPLLLFFWLKWAGYLAVAGLNLLAQISDRISPYGV